MRQVKLSQPTGDGAGYATADRCAVDFNASNGNSHHLIDTVGELIAAILNVDGRQGMPNIATGNIGDATHHDSKKKT